MTDLEALSAYHRDQDAEAFRHVVRTYQSLVYAACLRMLDNATDAEDAAQETFVRLVRHAGQINRNVAAWLHTTARTVANDRRRSDRARQVRERQWSELHEENSDDAQSILPVLDECLAKLPDEPRELLLQHYMQGRTQTDLAAEHGISQPAISKRLDKAVRSLRAGLQQSGVGASAVVIAEILTESASNAKIPATLATTLYNVGLAGIGDGTAAHTGLALLTGKLGLGVASVLVLAVLVVVALRHHPPPEPEPTVAAIPLAPPAPNTQLTPKEEGSTPTMEQSQPQASAQFRKASAREENGNVYLDPIPLYPRHIRWVDQQGNTVRYEYGDGTNHCRIMGNLYCAMRMQGHDIDWAELVCASGDAFRSTFENRWAQDVEFVTRVDHFALACETLGFTYTWSTEQDRATTLARIDESLRNGRPALISGWGSRHWRVVVGLEPANRLYRCIGGLVWEEGAELLRLELPDGTEAPASLAPEQCLSAPIPSDDWYGPVLAPEQVARNALFLLGERQEIPPPLERIRRTLRIARQMNRPLEIPRKNLVYRANAREYNMGHDGWKFYYSPWEGTFITASEGIRAWATLVEKMEEPTYDFEMLHGIDTAMGQQFQQADSIVNWLRWAETQVTPEVAAHLRVSRRAFAELAKVKGTDLGLCCPGFVEDDSRAKTYEEVAAVLDTQPALCYLLNAEQRTVLGERGKAARNSPWGWRLLPSDELFDEAKVLVSDRLRRLADLRDSAFRELALAEKAMAEPKTRLDWIPPGRPNWHQGWINGYARGLQLVANYIGAQDGIPAVSYDTVMGDLGQAFVMQGEASGSWHPGGWPVAPAGLACLPFLQATIGREIRLVAPPADAPRDDPAAFYRKWFEPVIRQEIAAGRPCLAGYDDWWCIVTGYDPEKPVLFGMCSNVLAGEEKVEPVELPSLPFWLVVFGEPLDRLERRTADAEALRFALALHREQAYLKTDFLSGQWRTGIDSFACWTRWLRDPEREQPAHGHGNAKGFIVRNRRTAIRYLRSLQPRHPGPAAQHLEHAIGTYQEVIAAAQKVDTSPQTIATPEGRERTAQAVEHVSELEQQAMQHIEKALQQMP